MKVTIHIIDILIFTILCMFICTQSTSIHAQYNKDISVNVSNDIYTDNEKSQSTLLQDSIQITLSNIKLVEYDYIQNDIEYEKLQTELFDTMEKIDSLLLEIDYE